MTTFNVPGVRLYFDDEGESVYLASASARIITPSETSTFSYTVTGFDDGVPQITLDGDFFEIHLDGSPTTTLEDFSELQPFIVEIDWSRGTSVVLGINIEPFGQNDSELYFILDGPAPEVDDVDDWEDFDNSITAIRTPTGDFAPGVDIAWNSFIEQTNTEEDDFSGTDGDDLLVGGRGDDYFRTSEGDDTFSGGNGFDQVTYGNASSGVVVDLGARTATDDFGDTDTLRSIEMVRGSAYDDDLTGDRKANHIRGLAGDDTLDGGRGTDLVRYDRDARYGGEDGVTVNLKKGFAIDGFGDRDTLSRFERVMGSDSKDKFIGSRKGEEFQGLNGHDVIDGGGGDDEIYGGYGNDKITGGSGDDMLSGGSGADRFIFKGNFGDDEITDFSTGGRKEKIDLSSIREIKSFRDLKRNHVEENDDGDVVIHDNDGNSITLLDVSISDLSGNDFIF